VEPGRFSSVLAPILRTHVVEVCVNRSSSGYSRTDAIAAGQLGPDPSMLESLQGMSAKIERQQLIAAAGQTYMVPL
jgi:hypothetical protein